MEKILIVEDDRLIAELERDYLEAAGFEAQDVYKRQPSYPGSLL